MNSDFMDSLDTNTDQPQSLDFDLDLELPDLEDSDFGNFDSLSTDLGDLDSTAESIESEEPVTLTADELNDIISVDFDDSVESDDGDNSLAASFDVSSNNSLDVAIDDSDIPLPTDIMSLSDDTELDIDTDDLPDADFALHTDPSSAEIDDLEMVNDDQYDSLDSDISINNDESLVLPGDLDLELPEIDSDDLSIEYEPKAEIDDLANQDFDADFSSSESDFDMADIDSDSDESFLISDDELQQDILGDDVQIPPLSILDSDDDDTITLTSDELTHIVSDGAIEIGEAEAAADNVSEKTELIDIDDVSQDGVIDAPSFFQEEDDSPVALTDDELAGILDDTILEVVEEEGAAPETLDQERENTVAEAADQAGVNRDELKKMIGYLDDLLGQLPDETVKEFSRSEYFQLYKKVIDDLGVFK